jgi:hypothetical protein
MQSVYLERIMKKNAAKGYKKQSQNKPNQHYVTDIYFLGLPGEILIEVGLEIIKIASSPYGIPSAIRSLKMMQ